MEKTILELIELKKGSYKAFTSLYEQYFDLLYGFVFNLTHSHDLTQDLVQDTFIKIWINKEQINTELSFKSYLFKIAKNQIIDQLRKLFRNPVFEDYQKYAEEEALAENNSDAKIDFDEFNRLLGKFKKKLSPRQCKVFEMCKEEGLSASVVAKELKISEQAVYNYLSQALKLLKQQIKHPYLSLFF
ncbi:RNA polymerase subunit sigma-24 [Bacteroidales bacterium]|nr:RNA polymerase subunit sigma-24 [Bacteroidales bacterium]